MCNEIYRKVEKGRLLLCRQIQRGLQQGIEVNKLLDHLIESTKSSLTEQDIVDVSLMIVEVE